MYKTTDFYLTAYLQAKGYILSSVEPDRNGDTRRCVFVFEDVPKTAILSYYKKDEESKVIGLDFVYAIKRVREVIYNVPK